MWSVLEILYYFAEAHKISFNVTIVPTLQAYEHGEKSFYYFNFNLDSFTKLFIDANKLNIW